MHRSGAHGLGFSSLRIHSFSVRDYYACGACQCDAEALAVALWARPLLFADEPHAEIF